MVIPRTVVDAIIAQARDEFPNEACGVLAGKGGQIVHCYPIKNADASPVHFTLDPKEQLDALTNIDDRDWDLAAIYHSHTHTRAYPSATDIEMAQISMSFYPDTLFVILSLARQDLPEIRAFRLDGKSVTDVPLTVEE